MAHSATSKTAGRTASGSGAELGLSLSAKWGKWGKEGVVGCLLACFAVVVSGRSATGKRRKLRGCKGKEGGKSGDGCRGERKRASFYPPSSSLLGSFRFLRVGSVYSRKGRKGFPPSFDGKGRISPSSEIDAHTHEGRLLKRKGEGRGLWFLGAT